LIIANSNIAGSWQQLRQVKYLLGPLVLFQLWTALQLLALPLDWLQFFAPFSADVYQSTLTTSENIVPLSVSLSVPLSIDPAQTQIALRKGISYCLFVMNLALLITHRQRLKLLCICIVTAGTCQAFYGTMQALAGGGTSLVWGLPNTNSANGSFVYRNHFANFLILCLSIGSGLLVTQLYRSRANSWSEHINRLLTTLLGSKIIIRLALVIMVIALVVSRSRMGNSAFFSATIITSVLALIFYRQRPQAFTIFILSLLAIDTLIVGSWFGLEEVKQRLEATVLSQEMLSHEIRVDVIAWTQELIQQTLWTGTGGGSFYTIFPAYQQTKVAFFDHAHNEYLQFIIEYGVIASTLLGIMVLASLLQTLRTQYLRQSNFMKGIAFGCAMAIIGMMIHISVDFNLQSPANTLYFLTVLTLCWLTKNMPNKH
jgi:O-antigen ligase